jgi:hypothetical protein
MSSTFVGHLTPLHSTVKYTDDLVLLAKEIKFLQGTINQIIEFEKCYEM